MLTNQAANLTRWRFDMAAKKWYAFEPGPIIQRFPVVEPEPIQPAEIHKHAMDKLKFIKKLALSYGWTEQELEFHGQNGGPHGLVYFLGQEQQIGVVQQDSIQILDDDTRATPLVFSRWNDAKWQRYKSFLKQREVVIEHQ